MLLSLCLCCVSNSHVCMQPVVLCKIIQVELLVHVCAQETSSSSSEDKKTMKKKKSKKSRSRSVVRRKEHRKRSPSSSRSR